MRKTEADGRDQQRTVNLTWVVVVLTIVALLEGLQRKGLFGGTFI